MGTTNRCGSTGVRDSDWTRASGTPGPFGVNDAADPSRQVCYPGDAPGPVGVHDHAAFIAGPARSVAKQVTELSQRAEGQAENPHPAVRVTGGKIAIAHIPIPGTNGLFVELRPRGHAASTGPASTLYVRDLTRGQQLRLDFSYQPADRRLQYHWSPYGSLDDLTADDASAHKRGEPGAYSAAKQYRCAGRDLILLGLPVDAYRIVIARPWWRQATREVAGWLGTWSVFDATEVWGPPPPRPGKPGVETLIPDTQAGASQGPVGAAWSPGEAYDWVEEIALEAVPEIVLSAMPAPSDRR